MSQHPPESQSLNDLNASFHDVATEFIETVFSKLHYSEETKTCLRLAFFSGALAMVLKLDQCSEQNEKRGIELIEEVKDYLMSEGIAGQGMDPNRN